MTVCVVTYNHAGFIRHCLESVLAQQSAGSVEILVGVDLSTDGTADLVAEMAAKHPGVIRAFFHDKRQGAAGNVKFLLARAEGEFIAHLDGDDAWLPNKLAVQLSLLERYPQAVAAFCNARVTEPASNGDTLGRFSDAPFGLLGLGQLMCRGNFLNNSSMVFRAHARLALQALPEEYIDFHGHLTLATLGPLAYTDEELVLYRWSTPGSLVNRDNARVRELYWRALESVPRHLATPETFRAANADFLRRVAFRSVRTRSVMLWREWWVRVRAQTPGPSWRLVVGVLAKSSFEALRQMRSSLVNIWSPGSRVFYHYGSL